MAISVFLSYPRPYRAEQRDFIEALQVMLRARGLEPRTLGVTDYDVDAPLQAIRRLMLESNGLITVALRRARIEHGQGRPNSDLGQASYGLQGQWMTSPWVHIEPAMAFQLGLPILVLRESGVIADGVLERGVTGTYLPEFALNDGPETYLESDEWRQLVSQWEARVRWVVEEKGKPPLAVRY